jgi:hypothetical protein
VSRREISDQFSAQDKSRPIEQSASTASYRWQTSQEHKSPKRSDRSVIPDRVRTTRLLSNLQARHSLRGGVLDSKLCLIPAFELQNFDVSTRCIGVGSVLIAPWGGDYSDGVAAFARDASRLGEQLLYYSAAFIKQEARQLACDVSAHPPASGDP